MAASLVSSGVRAFAQANPAPTGPGTRAYAARINRQGDLLFQAKRELQAGRPKNALPLLQRSLATYNGDQSPHLYLAFAYNALHDRARALQAFRRVLHPPGHSDNPFRTNPAVRMRFVQLLLEGTPAEAREAQAVYNEPASSPLPPSLQNNIAAPLWNLLTVSPLPTTLPPPQRKKALEARAHGVLSLVKMGVNDNRAALRESEFAFKIQPKEPVFHLLRGVVLDHVRQKNTAKAEWSIAARTGTDSVQAAAQNTLRRP